MSTISYFSYSFVLLVAASVVLSILAVCVSSLVPFAPALQVAGATVVLPVEFNLVLGIESFMSLFLSFCCCLLELY